MHTRSERHTSTYTGYTNHLKIEKIRKREKKEREEERSTYTLSVVRARATPT